MEQDNNNATKKQRIFISHASKDYHETEMKENFCDPLRKIYDVVCTTEKELKGFLHDEINQEIGDCDIFFALITENYVRSPHCLYELSVARYAHSQKHAKRQPDLQWDREFIVVYANDDLKERTKDFVMADLTTKDLKSGQNLERCTNSLIDELSLNNQPGTRDKIRKFLERASHQDHGDLPYIGMPQNIYDDLLCFCEKESIIKLGNGTIYNSEEMIARCQHAKDIYIVSTTGAGLLKMLKEVALKDALLNKANIKVIIPDRGSRFCTDVAEAECCREGYNDVIAHLNMHRIESEFEATFQYLNEAYCLAKHEQKIKKLNGLGKITVYSSRTLLRQTLLLTVSENNETWGWINMTMAPLRTAETPCLAISDKDKKKGIDKAIITHCECLIKMSIKIGAKQEINGKTIPNPLEKRADKDVWQKKTGREAYWTEKMDSAKAFMKKREQIGRILIEVAAQHPLHDGIYPNEEFQKRLDTAIQLSHQLGCKNVWFYVPGSRHKFDGVDDKISLSEAGKNYLIEHGIDANRIYADETNQKYKGEQGVYNSADECYVASCIFKDKQFGRLICVCSPYQTMRKTFYYLEFGLIPECYGVPVNAMFHNPVSEFFGSLHYTVYDDPSWQDSQSEAAINSRLDRKPL